MTFLSQRPQVEQLVAASQGYDLPAFAKLRDFKTWAEEGSAQRYAVQLPAARGPRCLDRLCAGPDRDCHPAVFAGPNDQDDRAAHATRRKHRSGDRRGIRRDRRLYARIETGRKTGNSDRVESMAVLDGDIARKTSQSISRHRDPAAMEGGFARGRDKEPSVPHPVRGALAFQIASLRMLQPRRRRIDKGPLQQRRHFTDQTGGVEHSFTVRIHQT